MSRLSSIFLRTLVLMIAFSCFVIFGLASVHAFQINREISRTLTNHEWRMPTEIISAKSGRVIVRVYGSDWRSTPPVLLRSIPDYVASAFLAAEDVRFRRHVGIDPIGILRALLANLRERGIAQGGSTIDQQLIKSKFLSNERTWRRKLIEAAMAMVLDFRLSKDEILEAYLNDVYLGHFRGKAVLGVDEAARIYFDRRPADLTLSQAALLAGMVRAPNRDTPDRNPDVARSRRDSVLETMRSRGWIDEKQFRDAVASPARFHYGRLRSQPFPWYLAALRDEIVQKRGARALGRAGLRIVSELDPQMQMAAENAVASGTDSLRRRHSWISKQSSKDPLQAVLISLDPASGGIRALVGGSDFTASPIDRSSRMRRQPGSAFKTFAYLTAIESRRYTPASLLLDAPVKIDLAGGKTWEPENYDERFRGRVTLREAFEKSLNVPTVRLAGDVGVDRIVRTTEEFGFDEKFEPVPAFPLGVFEVTPRELASAYTAFPNLGTRTEPYLVSELRDRENRVLYRHEAARFPVADAAAAYVTHSLLRGVVLRGTASRLRRYGLSGVAGKTGTTNDYRDAWFVGYTPDLVTTVWVGFDRGAPLRLSSAEAAIPIWGAYMRDVRSPRKEIAPPHGVVFREIDPETGYLWREGCPGPFRESFLEGTAPTRRCPKGVLGKIARRILFDREHFDEPPAITFEKFRRWSTEIDQGRRRMKDRMDRLKDFLFRRK